jgi:polygalacturonase
LKVSAQAALRADSYSNTGAVTAFLSDCVMVLSGGILFMELDFVNSRMAIVKISDGKFFAKAALNLDGEIVETDRIITKILDLSPETEYNLTYGAETLVFVTDSEDFTVDVKKLGAIGDGIADDTVFLQAAINICPENSRVLIPHGRYKTSSLFLKSGVNIEIKSGAELIFTNKRSEIPHLPGLMTSYDEKNEKIFGTWEGNPLPMFTSLINGFGVRNVCIYGGGTLDGNALSENGADWWNDEKTMKTAFRPRIIFLSNCENITVAGLTLKNSPSWTIHPFFSKNISFFALDINNPENSPNTDGINPESCENVNISGVKFTLGDDCVAIKSGKIWAAEKYKTPSKNVEISHCLMQNGHGAVTIGSEMAAGIYNVLVHHCEFINTDRGLRIKTRRGRGNLAIIDGIEFNEIKMTDVKVPFVVNAYYFCDPDGKSEYVGTREKLPFDERTPIIKRISLNDISCTGVICAGFFYGLPESPIEEIALHNLTFDYEKNGEGFLPAMLCGVSEVSKKGFYVYSVDDFSMKNVTGGEIETEFFPYKNEKSD